MRVSSKRQKFLYIWPLSSVKCHKLKTWFSSGWIFYICTSVSDEVPDWRLFSTFIYSGSWVTPGLRLNIWLAGINCSKVLTNCPFITPLSIRSRICIKKEKWLFVDTCSTQERRHLFQPAVSRTPSKSSPFPSSPPLPGSFLPVADSVSVPSCDCSDIVGTLISHHTVCLEV